MGISDVLYEAVEEIREYQAGSLGIYGGDLKLPLDKLVADMEAMRIELDTCRNDAFYEFIDAVGEVIAASPKRAILAETIEAFDRDCSKEYCWAIGLQAPTLLRNLMLKIACIASREAARRKEAVKDGGIGEKTKRTELEPHGASFSW